jgi:dUTP pyrophosphatase
MQINIKRLSPLAKMPTYATDGSGWFDLYAINTLPRLVQEGYPVVFDTGLAFEIPPGYGMFVLSRSGHGFKFDTRLSNCVGCIDSDYRGEVKVKLTCDVERDEAMPMSVMPGDRIAQACILPIPRVSFAFVDELGETARGKGGFGSTGA